MWRRVIGRICLLVSLAALLSGCLPATIATSHPYVLLRQEGDGFVLAPDEDEAYLRFEQAVLSDAALNRLLGLFDGTAKAILAEGMATRAPQTVANPLCVVLDSQESGVIHGLRVEQEQGQGRLELALGVGHVGQEELAWTREQMAPNLGLLLYELTGQRPVATSAPAAPAHLADPAMALQFGLAEAFAALRSDAVAGEPAEAVSAEIIALRQAQRQRADWVAADAYIWRFEGGQPTNVRRSRAEALATPGVAATFFYRLIREADEGYPTRYMLWFANYDAADAPYAKLLLALTRMPRRAASLESFVQAYQATFPAERAWIAGLAEEVWGAAPAQGAQD